MGQNNQALAPTVGGVPIVFNQPIDASLMSDKFQSGVQESLLPKLSIQGSRWTVILDSDRKIQVPSLAFDVVMIDARDQNSRAFFLGNFAPGDNKAPDCASVNGFNVDPGVPAQQSANCAVCPNAAFGTATNQQGGRGKGQACGQYRQVVIVPYDVLRLIVEGRTVPEEAVVCTLRIPASSLKDYGKYVKFLEKQGGNPTICVTRLSFAEGVGHPQPVFQAVQPLDAAEQQAVVALRNRDDVQQATLTPPRTAPEAAPGTWTQAAINPQQQPISFVPTPPQPSLADAVRQTAQQAAPQQQPVQPPPQQAQQAQQWPTMQQAAPQQQPVQQAAQWPTTAQPQQPPMAQWPSTPQQPQQPVQPPPQQQATQQLPWTSQVAPQQNAQPVQPPPTSQQTVQQPVQPHTPEAAADDILSRWTSLVK